MFIKERSWLTHVTSLLSGALGAVIILFIFHWLAPSPRLSTVNVTALVDAFINKQTQQSLTPTEQQQRVKAFGQGLEKILSDIAHKEHKILVPSEAVIAGADDITAEVQQRLLVIK